jgi:hypothetical protein
MEIAPTMTTVAITAICTQLCWQCWDMQSLRIGVQSSWFEGNIQKLQFLAKILTLSHRRRFPVSFRFRDTDHTFHNVLQGL